MKNKKLVYLLLFLTVVVWGMIFYRIFNYVNENSTPELSMKTKKISTDTAGVYMDTFNLILNYRDPFLGSNTIQRNDEGKKTNSVITAKKQDTKEVKSSTAKWPVLSYGGIVKNEGTKNMVIILNINGKSHLMKPGEVIKDCELLNVYRDSATVRFNGETKTVRYKSYN